MGKTWGSKNGVRRTKGSIDWNSETVRAALAKAKAAMDAAPTGEKWHALEKAFSVNTGIFKSAYTIRQRMKEKGII